MSWNFEKVAGPFSLLTEGPAWDGEAVLFTDIPSSRILRFDPRSGACAVWRTGTDEANGLMFDREGGLYGCEGGSSGRRIVR
ncbi:MAG: SMP-30/gluconolactonase/LRE family protein, partial [Candidatus Latescibacteria bacterium]|nr:SMP-30/gluconolactonase/LRE family protein [Candidatus Latescibacterota bacterium]